uniref:NADH dehydrogenase subunit 5 n=1 Tax=Geukensia demissa TaxID=27807 RepID=UPI001FAF4F93|nr:NADH dehydrogenase subunit 5 [Geukensia demissa]UJM44216.1 NADH dehydrogenase subunit 5 [Geukensia demissa]
MFNYCLFFMRNLFLNYKVFLSKGMGGFSNKFCVVMVLCGYGLLFVGSMVNNSKVFEYCLFNVDSLYLSFNLMLDYISIIFVGAVLIISGSVIVYSNWYMYEEIYYNRFIILIYFFVLSMICLIMIPNLVTLMIGWDGLGLVSFLLVCYYQNMKSLNAAMLTALTNRIGDVLILLSIGMFSNEGHMMVYNYDLIVYCSGLSFFILFAGMTKSAQMPFSSWLPAAMAAPTPVSSLVHSSTLVTAGVYLIIRCYGVVDQSFISVWFLQVMSILTLLMAGMAAVIETDFKKVIALSTLSNLSMMMFSISVGYPNVAFFHLITHAMFKALLFVSAGVVIHNNSGAQDLRLLGCGWSSFPTSMVFMVVSSLSLAGVPFLSGFYSKDMIIEMSFSGNFQWWLYLMVIVGAAFTSWYSFRILMSVMLGFNKMNMNNLFSKESYTVVLPMSFLFFGAIFGGSVLKSSLESLKFSCFLTEFDFILILFLILYGLTIMFLFLDVKFSFWMNKVLSFIGKMWNFKGLSTSLTTSVNLQYSGVLSSSLDQGWLEKSGPQGVYELLKVLSWTNQKIQSKYFLKALVWSFFLFFMAMCISFFYY